MRALLCPALIAAPLAGQSFSALQTPSPDRWEVESLADIRRSLGRERGALLVLLDSRFPEAEAALANLLAEDAIWPLGLRSLVLDPSKGIGLEIRSQLARPSQGPRWAFMGPNGQWVAEGAGMPLSREVAQAFQASGCRTRLEAMDAFLDAHPEQLNAVLEVLRERKRMGDLRTRKELGNAQRPTPGDETRLRVGSMVLSGEREERFSESHASLSEEADERIWREFARLLSARLPELLPLASRIPTPLASLVPECMWASSLLQSSARETLPEVERALAARPSDKGLWELWIALHSGDEEHSFAGLLGTLVPSPLTPPGAWPPPSIRAAYLSDCRANRRWRDLVEMAEPAWKRLQEAARDERDRFSQAGYLSAGLWDDLCDPLLEGLLRLNRTQDAEALLKDWLALSNWRGAVTRAQMIALECGQDSLVETWSELLNEE
jgi:hypothetical protein